MRLRSEIFTFHENIASNQNPRTEFPVKRGLAPGLPEESIWANVKKEVRRSSFTTEFTKSELS